MHVLYLDWFFGIIGNMIVREFFENSASRRANLNRAVGLRRRDKFELRPGNCASPTAIAHNESASVVGYFEEEKLDYIRISDPMGIKVVGGTARTCDHVERLEAAILQFPL